MIPQEILKEMRLCLQIEKKNSREFNKYLTILFEEIIFASSTSMHLLLYKFIDLLFSFQIQKGQNPSITRLILHRLMRKNVRPSFPVPS